MIYDWVKSGRCYDGSFQNEKALDLYVGFPRAEGGSSTITLWLLERCKNNFLAPPSDQKPKIKLPISWILVKAEVAGNDAKTNLNHGLQSSAFISFRSPTRSGVLLVHSGTLYRAELDL